MGIQPLVPEQKKKNIHHIMKRGLNKPAPIYFKQYE